MMMVVQKPETKYRKDYRAPDYLVSKVALVFDLRAQATVVSTRLEIRRGPGVADGTPMRLDGEGLRLKDIRLDGAILSAGDYVQDETGLTLTSPPAEFVLETTVEIDPEANSKLEGLYLSGAKSGTPIFCTQCEAEGFRRITYFPDRPDVMSEYEVTLRADKSAFPVLLSNGNLIDSGGLDDGRHFAHWKDPFPKPCYLFALVAGDLGCLRDQFTTAGGRQVALHIYVDKGNEERARFAMTSLQKSMAWDEQVYGLEYDLDLFNIVAIADFNMGAMENKSLNIFNSKYILASPDTATDSDYENIEAVVAHEYFHNWTGNRVTCRDWFQLSLKEGLTVFRDQQFSADMRSAAVKRIQDARTLRAAQFPEDAGPLAHPVRPDSFIEINNFYTATVYEKGAEVIGMIHKLLGAEDFRKGMDLYFQRHDGQAVTCDDFIAAMADASGADLEQFSHWYSQAGTPEVQASGNYDASRRRYRLTLRQSVGTDQKNSPELHIPFAVGLLDGQGIELKGTTLLHLRQAEQSFDFEDVERPPVPSLNRGFSAPVRVKSDLDGAALGLLMSRDSDPFNRWDAGQQYATQVLLRMAEENHAGDIMTLDPGYIDAFGNLLADDEDAAFLAYAMTLPSEGYVGEQMPVIHVDAVHAARCYLKRGLAEAHGDRLRDILTQYRDDAPYSPDARPAGRRALKNAALSYLACLEDEAAVTLLQRQFDTADNMTDRMAALANLNDLDVPARQAALTAFYDRYRDDDLVLDKWFALQATSQLPGTLARVRELLHHPAFNIRQPNKVRALIGAFAAGNLLHFHAADGAGYRFLGEQVTTLDETNPQIAARILAPLGRWRRYDPNRQEKMQAALKTLLERPGLSRDVFEITEKSLG